MLHKIFLILTEKNINRPLPPKDPKQTKQSSPQTKNSKNQQKNVFIPVYTDS